MFAIVSDWISSVFLISVLPALMIAVVGILVIRLVMNLVKVALEKSKLEKAAHSLILSLARVVLYVLLALTVADSIMLPMWRRPEEVDAFLKAVNRNAETTLLLETKEAVECLDTVLKHPLLDNIHIGLNDLHLSYGMTFLFEPFVNGVVESVCRKCGEKGIPCGVGGIARLGNGLVPAEHIITEHYRLGSSAAILSRAFCDTEKVGDISSVSEIFQVELQRIRDFEGSLSAMTEAEYEQNRQTLVAAVQNAAAVIRSRRMAEQT